MALDTNIAQFNACFAPITLTQLNAKAEMMARIDNKYVVQSGDRYALADPLSGAVDILDIQTQRTFTYDTQNFDDAAHSAAFGHHQGRRRGFKVRAHLC